MAAHVARQNHLTREGWLKFFSLRNQTLSHMRGDSHGCRVLLPHVTHEFLQLQITLVIVYSCGYLKKSIHTPNTVNCSESSNSVTGHDEVDRQFSKLQWH